MSIFLNNTSVQKHW